MDPRWRHAPCPQLLHSPPTRRLVIRRAQVAEPRVSTTNVHHDVTPRRWVVGEVRRHVHSRRRTGLSEPVQMRLGVQPVRATDDVEAPLVPGQGCDVVQASHCPQAIICHVNGVRGTRSQARMHLPEPVLVKARVASLRVEGGNRDAVGILCESPAYSHATGSSVGHQLENTAQP